MIDTDQVVPPGPSAHTLHTMREEGRRAPVVMPTIGQGRAAPQAAVLDFGGVMTQPVTHMFKAFATAVGLTREESRAVVAAVYTGGPAGDGAIQQLERGDITTADLGRHLAAAIATVTGRRVDPEGLFAHMWGQLELDDDMIEGVRRLRRAGARTALLSNSWGAENYPFAALEGVFDVLVLSGTERVRKPDEEIYRRTLQRLDLPPARCVFVDDLTANVEVAVRLGLHGIVHTTATQTLAQMEGHFGLPAGSLSGRGAPDAADPQGDGGAGGGGGSGWPPAGGGAGRWAP